MGSRQKGRKEISVRIGEVIRARRTALGLSQEEFADRSDHHRTYIGFLERGERCPNVATLERIAGALGVKVSDLVKEAGY